MALNDAPPTRLGDRYSIVGPLGEGGMGVVYRARDERLGRLVAVKLLPAKRAEEPSAMARLEREAQAIAALEHPGIVQVFDIGHQKDGGLYVVMELVRGVTLRERMRGGVASDETIAILRDVAVTLDTAHEHGFVHRDIKPDNVMVRDDGRVTLLDFGLVKTLELTTVNGADDDTAQAATGLTGEGTILGTCDYLAPEQVEGDAGPAADQFALAVMAYEMLTGNLPWPARTPLLAISRRLSEAPVAPSEARPELPTSVDEALSRALSRAPAERYPSTVSFVDALDAALGDAVRPAVPSRDRDPETEIMDLDAEDTDVDDADPVGVVDESTAEEGLVEKSIDALEQAATLHDPSSPPPAMGADTSEPRQRPPWLGGLAVAGVVLLAALSLYSAGDSARGPVDGASSGRGTTADAGTIGATAGNGTRALVACPIVEAAGVAPPAAWLGAAAADFACRWTHWWLGGRAGTTLVPAELLEWPALPSDASDVDPFAEPTVRAASLDAARRRGGTHIDGRVVRRGVEFAIELRLVTSSGDHGDTASAKAPSLQLAVHQAMAALSRNARFPARGDVPAEVRAWTSVSTPEQGITLEAARGGLVASFGAKQPCSTLQRGAPKVLLYANLSHECAHWQPPKPDQPVRSAVTELDRSTPASFAATAAAFARTHPDADALALAGALANLRKRQPSAEGRSALALAEARILAALPDQHARANLILRGALADTPRSWALREQLLLSTGRSGYLGIVRSAAAWTPSNADVWAHFVLAREMKDSRTRHRLTIRADELAPTAPNHGSLHVKLLLAAHKTEAARGIATRFAKLERGVDRIGAEYIAALLDVSDARFERALDRLQDALLEARSFGWFRNNDVNALRSVWRLARLLGRLPEVASALAERLVLSGQVQLVAQNRLHVGPLIQLCMQARRDVAQRCLDALDDDRRRSNVRQLDSSGAFLQGARAYVAGNHRDAVERWRPLIADAFHAKLLPVDAFDRAGELELAERLDALRDESRRLHGEALSTPRIAKRAAAKGDHGRAREFAQRAIDAWSGADAAVPAVADMRLLLSTLPPVR
jgi:serine/threonine protein kinase